MNQLGFNWSMSRLRVFWSLLWCRSKSLQCGGLLCEGHATGRVGVSVRGSKGGNGERVKKRKSGTWNLGSENDFWLARAFSFVLEKRAFIYLQMIFLKTLKLEDGTWKNTDKNKTTPTIINHQFFGRLPMLGFQNKLRNQRRIVSNFKE